MCGLSAQKRLPLLACEGAVRCALFNTADGASAEGLESGRVPAGGVLLGTVSETRRSLETTEVRNVG
jgi:hypothetical protein